MVDNRPVIKAGTPVQSTAEITVTAVEEKYVCRHGFFVPQSMISEMDTPVLLSRLVSGMKM